MAGSVLTIAQALSVPFVTSKGAFFFIETLQHTAHCLQKEIQYNRKKKV